MGADKNYHKVVDMACAEYCWLFGSDDLLAPSSVVLALQVLASNSDIYLWNRTECDFAMRPMLYRKWLPAHSGSRKFQFHGDRDIAAYIDQADTVGALFSYLTSICFKRQRWLNLPYDERFTGSAYSHAYMLLEMMHEGCTLEYIDAYFVQCRTGNDSFMDQGLLKRILLDLQGYRRLAEVVFYDMPYSRAAVFELLKGQYPWWRWVKLSRIRKTEPQLWTQVHDELRMIGVGATLLSLAQHISDSNMLYSVWLKVRQLMGLLKVPRKLGHPIRKIV